MGIVEKQRYSISVAIIEELEIRWKLAVTNLTVTKGGNRNHCEAEEKEGKH